MRLRFLILCVFSLAIQTLTAQVEHSILDSGLVWRYRSSGGSDNPVWYNNDIRIAKNDTVINNKPYFKFRDNNGIQDYITEDTVQKQIWIYHDSIEVKIIDFNANIGDTLDLSSLEAFNNAAVVIDTLGTIFLDNGEVRKAMKIELYHSNFNLQETIYWIDGIGSSEGIEYFNTHLSLYSTFLSCVFNETNGVQTIYGNCALGIDELENINLIVWPNPAQDVLNIETDSPMERIAVYNQLGGIVSSYELVVGSKLEQLDVSRFKRGLYFLVVETEKGVETRKFVKQD